MAAIIKAEFVIGSDRFEVVELEYELTQNADRIGQPSGEVAGGNITVTLRSLDGDSRFGWMVSSSMKKSGKIEFIDREGKEAKTLEFEDAYCIGYKEHYKAFSDNDGTTKEGSTERLTLTCRKIKVGNESHENTW